MPQPSDFSINYADYVILPTATLHVDADAPSGGSGAAWGDAFVDLQSALEAAAILNADANPANDVTYDLITWINEL